ncbi:MAG: phosphate ABC transporter permease subunit PstC [Bacteroidales bacterium]|nr:phosphate ABC transporter permease subunit PstC [Bacteroidales bacterium]
MQTTIIMVVALCFVLSTPLLIAMGLGYKSMALFREVPILNLIFNSVWEPASGNFGFLAYIISSVLITLLAILIAGPVCLFTAIYLTQYARRAVMRFMQPVIDILAGIPSVVYGVWGILVIVPLVSERLAPYFNVQSTGYTLITGAVVLSVMIIPFILNILLEIFRTLPIELSEATLSLGATKWEVIKHVLMRKAKPGIISAFGLGISRAFGETMAVLMVAGNVAKMPHGIFDPVYPLPALIANNYGEMMSIPLYDSALMVAALFLFLSVITFNAVSRIAIYRLEKKL